MRIASCVLVSAALGADLGISSHALAGTVEGAAIARGAGRCKADGAPAWRDAATGDVLTAGVSVQASDEQPLELLLPDGVTIELEPGAQARWMSATKLPTETNGWTRGYYLVLQEGELEVRMPPGPKGSHAFLVVTRAGTLTDWRGQLHVMVHGDDEAAAIYQGALVVGSNGQGFPVYDGAGIVLKKGVNPDRSRGIPGAPAWEGPGEFRLAGQGERANLDLRWGAVGGAASYRVEIATDPTMVRVVQRSTTVEPRLSTAEPAPGARYWARVRSVDARGIVGEWSTALPIRVLRYQLPDGAVVASDGAIVVPEHASVSLADTDGMEAAYENLTSTAPGVRSFAVPLYWSKLPGSLRMPDDAMTRIVHVRDPASGTETKLVLAKRLLRADVELLPKTARWPFDPIDARIVIADPSGRTNAGAEPVTIETMLDLTPVPITWQRHGSTWLARIPPQPIDGPSVVRIVVKDARGAEIGRGFMEIDAPMPVARR